MRITNRLESARIVTNQIGVVIAALLAAVLPCWAQRPTTQQFTESLRTSLAMDYGNPNAHLELAKALKAQGEALTAFCICEHAKALFGEDAFASSFDTVFRGHISDVLFHARKQVLQQAIGLAPRSVELLKQIADLDVAHGEPLDAVIYLRRAIAITPDDFGLVEAMQLDFQLAGQTADADAVLSDWCSAHPDSAPAWEKRVRDQIDQNSDSTGGLLDQAIAKFPADGELHLMRAQLEQEKNPNAAQADYVSAARLSPDSAAEQGAAAGFFTKVHHDPQRAINYYLATYFLNPDFNDWESVDERIREVADEIAQAKLAGVKASTTSVAALIEDPNPLVAAAAIDVTSGKWSDRFTPRLLKLMNSDCPEVRAACIRSLSSHPAWSAGSRLDEMLADTNPWTRAAGASLSAAVRRSAAIRDLKPLLADPSILVRYTAAITLIDQTNNGRATVAQAMRSEPSVWLKATIAQALTQKPR